MHVVPFDGRKDVKLIVGTHSLHVSIRTYVMDSISRELCRLDLALELLPARARCEVSEAVARNRQAFRLERERRETIRAAEADINAISYRVLRDVCLDG